MAYKKYISIIVASMVGVLCSNMSVVLQSEEWL
jgi:hypothetical protein